MPGSPMIFSLWAPVQTTGEYRRGRYYLHGTVTKEVDDHALDPADDRLRAGRHPANSRDRNETGIDPKLSSSS